MTAPTAREVLRPDVLRGFFRDRGWSIAIDGRERPADTPLDPFEELAAALTRREPLDVERTTRLYMSADDIEAALVRLHGAVTRDEATVMAAAQAAADALRGNRIVEAER